MRQLGCVSPAKSVTKCELWNTCHRFMGAGLYLRTYIDYGQLIAYLMRVPNLGAIARHWERISWPHAQYTATLDVSELAAGNAR